MSVCDELATQLSGQQSKLTADTSSQLENNTDVSLASATLIANDPGAIVPLNTTNINTRMGQLLAASPPNYMLWTQYSALVQLMILQAGWVATINQDNTNIAATQAEQAANGC